MNAADRLHAAARAFLHWLDGTHALDGGEMADWSGRDALTAAWQAANQLREATNDEVTYCTYTLLEVKEMGWLPPSRLAHVEARLEKALLSERQIQAAWEQENRARLASEREAAKYAAHLRALITHIIYTPCHECGLPDPTRRAVNCESCTARAVVLEGAPARRDETVFPNDRTDGVTHYDGGNDDAGTERPNRRGSGASDVLGRGRAAGATGRSDDGRQGVPGHDAAADSRVGATARPDDPSRLDTPAPPEPGTGDSQEVVSRVSSGGSSVTREDEAAVRAVLWRLRAAIDVPVDAELAALDRLVAALVAATDRTEEIVAERIEGWRTHVQSKLAKMGAELLEAQAGFEMYEAVAYQERERAEAAGARAAELETALAAIVEAEYGIDGNPVYRRNADTGEAIARARHVLARAGDAGLGGVGGASSTDVQGKPS